MKEYENQVVQELLRAAGFGGLFDILASATHEEIDYTGVGYYLMIKDTRLPIERHVLNEPWKIVGRPEGVAAEVGFLAFIENNEFTLECYSWGGDEIPEDIRDRKVELAIGEP